MTKVIGETENDKKKVKVNSPTEENYVKVNHEKQEPVKVIVDKKGEEVAITLLIFTSSILFFALSDVWALLSIFMCGGGSTICGIGDKSGSCSLLLLTIGLFLV